MRAASERVAKGGHIIETECGLIEYGNAGNGPPVLVIHGAGGGYDQGLLIGSQMFGADLTLIAASRFGYLNSPIPEDSSLEAQADAYACLLDALDIDRVIVVAFSAGGPSGLHFARRYPERTATLIMRSAISYIDPSKAEDREREASINRVIGLGPITRGERAAQHRVGADRLNRGSKPRFCGNVTSLVAKAPR